MSPEGILLQPLHVWRTYLRGSFAGHGAGPGQAPLYGGQLMQLEAVLLQTTEAN